MENHNRLFEEVINENAIIEYSRLYNALATQIGVLYDALVGLKSVMRIAETTNGSQKTIEDVYTEIDTALNNIRTILSNMREQEQSLIFASNATVEGQTLTNHTGFANLYAAPKREVFRNLSSSINKLTQIKTEVIDKIKKITSRNVATRKWNEYKNDVNEISAEINHVDEIVMEYATKVDKKFAANLVQIISSQAAQS